MKVLFVNKDCSVRFDERDEKTLTPVLVVPVYVKPMYTYRVVEDVPLPVTKIYYQVVDKHDDICIYKER